MKRLVIALLLLTPWVVRSMEPEELKAKEVQAGTVAKLLERSDRWVTSVEEILPGGIPPQTATRISQVIAQEILRKGPPIKKFILSHVSVPFRDFFGHTEHIIRVKFNSAGDRIVTLSYMDDGAMIWDSKTGKLILHLPAQSINFNSAGDKVVIIDMDEVAKICDAETGKLIHSLQGREANVKSTSAVFNPAGDKVATDCRNGTAKIWDVETGTLLHTLKHTEAWTPVFNAAGDKVVTGSCLDDTVMKWDVETGTLLHTRKNSVYHKIVTAAENVDQTTCNFSSAGNKVTFSESSDLVRIWDVETDTLLHTLEGHGGGVRKVLFNPAGDKLVTIPKNESYLRSDTGIWERDTVRIWDVKAGELLHSFRYHFSWNSAVFSPAGDKIVVGHEQVAGIWYLEPLLSTHEFLAENITLQQVAILNDIFEIMEARRYLKVLKEIAPQKVASLASLENFTFDFNKYPHLWDEYNAMPETIRRIFDPYVTKLSSNTEEQAQS